MVLAYPRKVIQRVTDRKIWEGYGFLPDRVTRGTNSGPPGGSGTGGGGVVVSGPPSGVTVDLAPWVYADLGMVGAGAMLAEDGEDGLPGPPGQNGTIGSNGAPGPQGPIGFGLDGQDGDEGMSIPGPPGAAGGTGTVTTTGSPLAGQNTIFSSPTAITSGAITTPIAEPFFGQFADIVVNDPHTGNIPVYGIGDVSSFSALNPALGEALYVAGYFAPTFAGTDGGSPLVFAGLDINPTYSGVATGGSGAELFGINMGLTFSGSGTLDYAVANNVGIIVLSGTVTNVDGLALKTDIQGGAVTNLYSIHRYPDIASSAGTSYFLYQDPTATNYLNELVGLNLSGLTAGELVGTDAGQNLASIAIGSGLSLSGGTLSATSAPGAVGFGLDGFDGEDGMPIPGPPGAAGSNGAAGLNGLNGMPGLDGEEGQEGFAIPGPTGPTGASGTGSMTLITTSTPSGTGVVTFTLSGLIIPVGVGSFLITGTGISSAAASNEAVNLTFNGDTGNHYQWQELYATSTTVGGAQQGAGLVAQIAACTVPAATVTSTNPGCFEIWVFDYAQTTFWKAVKATSTVPTATTAAYVFVIGGVWESTAAITSITLTLAGGNWVAGSRISLYGLVQ